MFRKIEKQTENRTNHENPRKKKKPENCAENIAMHW
jgi:hypothetical protein